MADATQEHPEHHHREHEHNFEITIDRQKFVVHEAHMTGEQLRHVPTPPIGPDRDLYEEVHGDKDDRLIENAEVVHIRNGLVFFTTPHTINPG
jgi:hypothetical protein